MQHDACFRNIASVAEIIKGVPSVGARRRHAGVEAAAIHEAGPLGELDLRQIQPSDARYGAPWCCRNFNLPPARQRRADLRVGWRRAARGAAPSALGVRVSCFCNRAHVVGINEGACGARTLDRTPNSSGIQRPLTRQIISKHRPADA